MDILITEDWPREFYHFLGDHVVATLKKEGKPGLSVGSAYIAEVAYIHTFICILEKALKLIPHTCIHTSNTIACLGDFPEISFCISS